MRLEFSGQLSDLFSRYIMAGAKDRAKALSVELFQVYFLGLF